MGVGLTATLLVSFYEYYKFKESYLIFIVPCILYLFIPGMLYRSIALFVFCIVKAIQILSSKDITKLNIFVLYLVCAITLWFEHVWRFFV